MCNNLSAWVAFPRWLAKWSWMPFHFYVCYYCFYLLELLNCCASYNRDSVLLGVWRRNVASMEISREEEAASGHFSKFTRKKWNDLHNFRRSVCQCAATAEHEFADWPSETCPEPLSLSSFESCPLGIEALKSLMLVMIHAKCISMEFSIMTDFHKSAVALECNSATWFPGKCR